METLPDYQRATLRVLSNVKSNGQLDSVAEGGDVIDFGPGGGWLMQACLDRYKLAVTGIDCPGCTAQELSDAFAAEGREQLPWLSQVLLMSNSGDPHCWSCIPDDSYQIGFALRSITKDLHGEKDLKMNQKKLLIRIRPRIEGLLRVTTGNVYVWPEPHFDLSVLAVGDERIKLLPGVRP